MGIFGAKKEIGPDTVLQRRNDILFNEIDGEVVMLSIENGEYYGLDKVGSIIWNLLNNPITLDEIVDTLLNKFKITKDICLKDTEFFINKLIEKNLLLIKE